MICYACSSVSIHVYSDVSGVSQNMETKSTAAWALDCFICNALFSFFILVYLLLTLLLGLKLQGVEALQVYSHGGVPE